jgi:hypothetical protein
MDEKIAIDRLYRRSRTTLAEGHVTLREGLRLPNLRRFFFKNMDLA